MSKISVLMPVYNTPEKWLREAIESILNQTFSDFEFIIVNDGSTNNAEEVILSYKDKRIKYYKQENQGIAKTTNKMFDLAQGKYVALMDSDDYSCPQRLKIQFDFLEQNKNISILGAQYKVMGEDTPTHFPLDITFLDLLKQNIIANPTVMFRLSDINKFALRNDETYRCSHDYEFYSRAIKFLQIKNLPDVLLNYRVNHNSNSHANNELLIESDNKIKQKMLDFLTNDLKSQEYLKRNFLTKNDQKLHSFIQKIFSIKNSRNKKYKLITILGIKIKLEYQIKNLNKFKKFIDDDIKCSNLNPNKIKKLVVIPSESIKAEESVGHSEWLEAYYNPKKYFDKVYLLSPNEKEMSVKYGMVIIPCNNWLYKKLLKYIKPDCVRAYGGYWATKFAVKNRVKHIPIISSIHDISPNLLYKEIKKVDKAICVSNVVANLVKEKGLNKEKIVVFRDRVSLDIFSKKIDRPSFIDKYFDKNYKNILHIGRRVELKNINNTILSLKYLPDNYRLIQIGLGDEKQYEKIINENNLTGRCKFYDVVKNSDLAYLYSNADVMCVPSLSEGFGIVFIEAAACCCPVITSNIAPMNEYLTNNVNAVLIDDYENPKTIAEAIKKVCEDVNLNQTLRKNARNAALPFDRNKVNDFEVEIYKSITNNK